jgi:hypothetical protein
MPKIDFRNSPRVYFIIKLAKKILVAKYPRFIASINLKIRARNPKSINQKILWKMAYDNRKYQTLFADKYKVREYVTAKIGSQHLTKIHHVGTSGEQIPWNDLPKEFVIKCTHSSGGSVIVTSDAQKKVLPRALDSLNWGKYLIHPDNMEREKVQDFFDKLLQRNYADFPGFREFAYLGISPKLIVEELLKDDKGKIPSDFKFWCINGRVELIQVDVDRFLNHSRQLLDRNWNRIPVRLAYPLLEVEIAAPSNLQEMIKLAETLSNSVDFIRVDLYDLGKRLVFGELTNYPGGGLENFKPAELGLRLGSLLELDLQNNSLNL